MYYRKVNGEILLTEEGHHILSYFGLTLADLKRMSKDDLIALTKRYGDVLNDGKNYKNSTGGNSKAIVNKNNMFAAHQGFKMNTKSDGIKVGYGDSGSYSRYFDLDKWYSTFPFIITPKASKSERGQDNKHPTVKPIKLMSYLITLGSRENDLVLDPFVGSGTTYKACLQTHRRCIGIEINKEYIEIAKARVKPLIQQTRLG